MVPYTIDAVHAVRYQAARRTPASEIQKIFDWDASFLERVCRQHGIDIAVPKQQASSEPRPLRNTAPCPPNMARIIAKLTTRQAEIVRALESHVCDGSWCTADYIRHAINKQDATGRRAIGESISGLGRRLERIRAEYRVERLRGRGGGFRLVLWEAAP